ncbi:hypothetical protein FB451DRAFT_1163626 [Mycena latifolia]|nr:hypothetical protein FB451DRAFT_1163626 [Mycena latifolia]
MIRSINFATCSPAPLLPTAATFTTPALRPLPPHYVGPMSASTALRRRYVRKPDAAAPGAALTRLYRPSRTQHVHYVGATPASPTLPPLRSFAVPPARDTCPRRLALRYVDLRKPDSAPPVPPPACLTFSVGATSVRTALRRRYARKLPTRSDQRVARLCPSPATHVCPRCATLPRSLQAPPSPRVMKSYADGPACAQFRRQRCFPHRTCSSGVPVATSPSFQIDLDCLLPRPSSRLPAFPQLSSIIPYRHRVPLLPLMPLLQSMNIPQSSSPARRLLAPGVRLSLLASPPSVRANGIGSADQKPERGINLIYESRALRKVAREPLENESCAAYSAYGLPWHYSRKHRHGHT